MVPFNPLTDNVGPRQPNRPVDVATVQDLIARSKGAAPPDLIDGIADDTLFADIGAFQTGTMQSKHPDQVVSRGGPTLARLLANAGAAYAGPQIFQQSPTGPWKMLDQARFVSLFATQFTHLTAYNWTVPRPAGLADVLRKICTDQDIGDLRWAADMLATVQREAPDFLPVAEGGEGAGHPYGVPVQFKAADGKTYTNTYYGRGYVQLTWASNYLSVGGDIGQGQALEIDASKALDPDVAYNVMSYGMRNGTFTGHRLSDYLTGDRCDYRSARRIINGTDHATGIAACAGMIEGLLWLSTRAAFGTSVYTGLAAR